MSLLQDYLAKILEKTHTIGIDLSLTRINAAALDLNLLSLKCKVIKVAGTNGKGSTVEILHQIYRGNGYNVASYTSPHLYDFCERLKINSNYSTESMWVEAFSNSDIISSHYSLTYFERITLAALLIINKMKLDIIILEVGLGGELDAVNVVDSDVAIITNIGFDHKEFLGENISDIARAKAGIIAKSRYLVSTVEDGIGEIKKVQKNNSIEASYYSDDFIYHKYESGIKCEFDKGRELILSQINLHPKNIMAALEASAKLIDILPINYEILPGIIKNTHKEGRCQVIKLKNKIIVLDVAHNYDSALNLKMFLDRLYPNKNIVSIFSSLANKEYHKTLSVFSSDKINWNFAPFAYHKNCVDMPTLKKIIPQAVFFKSLTNAFISCYENAGKNDVIVAFGSFHVVSEIMPFIKKNYR